MRTQPCVFITHPEDGQPMVLAFCANVGDAVVLARTVSQTFQARAWVADFVRIAHVPQSAHQRQWQAERERFWGVTS